MKKLKEKLNAKLSKNGGFTLVEMLIVIAIIAVLVAVSMPVVTNQLEKAREAADAANIRSAYAEVMIAAIEEDTTNYTKEVKLTQQKDGWDSTISWPENLGGTNGTPKKDGKATVTYDATTGKASVTYST